MENGREKDRDERSGGTYGVRQRNWGGGGGHEVKNRKKGPQKKEELKRKMAEAEERGPGFNLPQKLPWQYWDKKVERGFAGKKLRRKTESRSSGS